MTEQECKAKENQLKQIRQKISDLGHEEVTLTRQIATYRYNKNIKGKYFYDEQLEAWVRPIKLNGEKVICITVDSDLTPYKDMKDYHVEEDYYWISDFPNMKEISKETFKNGIEKIINEAREIIFK